MISCIEWIPRNVADPNPKRYELSKAERELLAQEKNGMQQDQDDDEVLSDDDDATAAAAVTDYNEDNDMKPLQTPPEGRPLTATEIIASQQIDPSSLPKELRMDEYSDEEGEDKGKGGTRSKKGGNKGIGQLLIGNVDAQAMGIDENGKVEDIDIDANSDSDDDEDDDYDDLADIPDTREYMPTDVKGLEAMNFGGYSGINEFEEGNDYDEDSDVDDTNLKPDDALIIVAKTEEVGFILTFLGGILSMIRKTE